LTLPGLDAEVEVMVMGERKEGAGASSFQSLAQNKQRRNVSQVYNDKKERADKKTRVTMRLTWR
jgi:hypothetical protein